MWPFKKDTKSKIRSDVQENIESHGWQCQHVFDTDGEKQPFSYSIGFCESYNHPEIMIFGLKKDTMHAILSDIAEELKSGRVFEPNVRVSGVIGGDFEVCFKPLKESLKGEYAGIATRYYESPFDVYVMLWPDKNNTLPTEQECEITVQNEALKIV